MKFRLLVGAAAAVTALTAMTASAGAITNNYQEDNVHDFVGLMVALDNQGEFLPPSAPVSTSSRTPARTTTPRRSRTP
jgi:hypothetical protein